MIEKPPESTSDGEISDYSVSTQTEAETSKPLEESEEATKEKFLPKTEDIKTIIENKIKEYGSAKPRRITIRGRIASD